jgi:glutaredoxin
MVEIYGKNSCPYTQAARDHYPDAHYFDVKKDAAALTRMLEFSKGQRRVPVIVEDGTVTIGFGGT